MKGEDEPTNGRHAAAEDDRRWTAAQWAALAELEQKHLRMLNALRDAHQEINSLRTRIAELEKDHSRLVIVQECLRNEVEDTATLRTRIAELERTVSEQMVDVCIANDRLVAAGLERVPTSATREGAPDDGSLSEDAMDTLAGYLIDTAERKTRGTLRRDREEDVAGIDDNPDPDAGDR